MPDDLERLLPQWEKVWDAILNGTGEPDRRARAVELAELLLQWESKRPLQIGNSPADMLFVGRWCKVAACARQRLQDIRPFLAETKQKLLSDMQETRDAIASENETLLQQTTALEELTAELQLAVSDKAAVAAARMDVQQRLEAAREYKELRDDLAPAEQDIENFMQKSASGNGDSGMVPPVRRLAECLSGLSKIFQQRLCADREIQEAMIKFTETVSALQNLPEQFAAVDRMLNEAETTLSAQMNVQDEHDRQIRDRQG